MSKNLLEVQASKSSEWRFTQHKTTLAFNGLSQKNILGAFQVVALILTH